MLPTKDEPLINSASLNNAPSHPARRTAEMSFVTDLRSVFPPPHPAGRPFLLGCLAMMVLALFIGLWLRCWDFVWVCSVCFFPRSRPDPTAACGSDRGSGGRTGCLGRAWSATRRTRAWAGDTVAHLDFSFRPECAREPRAGDWNGDADRLSAWRLRQCQPGQGQ